MGMNQSNMDLIASGTVVYPNGGDPVLVSQNGRVKSIERTQGQSDGCITITLQADEGVAASNYGIDPSIDPDNVDLIPGSDSAIACPYNNRSTETPFCGAADIAPTSDPCVWTVNTAAVSGTPGALTLADCNFSFQIWRKRPV